MRPTLRTLEDRADSAAGPAAIGIALVVYRFDVGGLERHVANLCNHLDRARFRPLIVCMERSASAAKWLLWDDVQVIELLKRPRNDAGVVRRLARVLRERRVQVVHTHNWGTLVETTLARWWAGVPVHVHAERGTLLDDHAGRGLRYRLRARVLNWALRRCDAVVTNARNTALRMESLCRFPLEKVNIIPNGVEPQGVVDRQAARQRVRGLLGIRREAGLIGSVGRLRPVKNFAMAIDALAEPDLRGRDVHLVVVGDGPEHESLAARARERGVADRVHLVGRREDVPVWLAAMDVYVNTSLSEGMSQSVVEAMAAGLPMVVTDVGDNAALVEGRDPCGTVVCSRDATAMATAVADLLLQPGRRAQLAEHARRRYVSRYGMQRMVEAYEALYSRLTK